MKSKNTMGHLAALFTVAVWGTTLISTKVLLNAFQPVEILFFRFSLGFLALLAVCPHRLKGTSLKQECTLAAAGLCGICLYYLLENMALSYSLASNVGVILSAAPFFAAILSHLVMKGQEKLPGTFFAGFIVAMVGIGLISFNGAKLELNPLGDLLAVAAALLWACYSVLTKKIASFGYNIILTTRRVFFYGLLCMVPALFLFDFKLGLSRLETPAYLFHILFLGLGASALCFITWNTAIKYLGPVSATTYIYAVPVITVVISALFLHEQITPLSGLGTALTLAGMLLSECRTIRKREVPQGRS